MWQKRSIKRYADSRLVEGRNKKEEFEPFGWPDRRTA